MKATIKRLLERVLSRDEIRALGSFAFERKISRHHRRGLRLLRTRDWRRPRKINLGSGPVIKPGYLNVDLLPGGDLTLDLRRGLPFDSDCCERIISEHFFEHLEHPGVVLDLMRECRRVLQPGGELRISVPDTEWPLRDYLLGENSSYLQACRENRWHPPECQSSLEHLNYHFRQGGEHRYAYDYETLAKAFAAAGFIRIERVPFDPEIDAEHRRRGSVVVSGRK